MLNTSSILDSHDSKQKRNIYSNKFSVVEPQTKQLSVSKASANLKLQKPLLAGLLAPLIFVAALLFFSIPFMIFPHNTIFGLFLPIVAELFTISMACRIAWGTFRFNLNIVRFYKPTIKQFLGAFGVGLLSFFVLQITAAFISSMFNTPVGSSKTSESLIQGNNLFVALVLCLVAPILAPVCEELFFRGIVFGFIVDSAGKNNRKLRTTLAFLYSAIFFAALHIQGMTTATDFVVVGVTFLNGIIFALIVYKTNNVFLSFTSHSAYNSITCLTLFASWIGK